jgi:hypothetical protein
MDMNRYLSTFYKERNYVIHLLDFNVKERW